MWAASPRMIWVETDPVVIHNRGGGLEVRILFIFQQFRNFSHFDATFGSLRQFSAIFVTCPCSVLVGASCYQW